MAKEVFISNYQIFLFYFTIPGSFLARMNCLVKVQSVKMHYVIQIWMDS